MRVSRARSGVSSAHGVVVSLERNPRYACSPITHRLRTTTHASAFACNGLGAHLASRFAPSNTAVGRDGVIIALCPYTDRWFTEKVKR